jgi:alginate O-acetyltransferase complex protein AlgJ
VGRRGDAGLEPIQPWRESPVLLLGDSHGLVFHGGGDMHARGAGLADHLAKELGFPVDLVAVRGSGATPARISLMRRRDNLAGKRVVIWCLSAREFTESVQGWRPLPVIRGASPGPPSPGR